MRNVTSRAGFSLPVLGQGTWMMAEDASRRADEARALALGIDLGLSLIDTAEMYADGGAEELVAEVIAGKRDQLYLVSKVLPYNASYEGTIRACEQSLRRLGTDRLDLYLLHWAGDHPLQETYRAFETLVEDGKILNYGVSNFDVEEMERSDLLSSGVAVGTNQILYNLTRRGVEKRLVPWCREREIPIMAYSPLEQARLSHGGALKTVAARHGCKPYQIALAWTVRESGVMTIPKATRPDHVRQNVGALEIELTPQDLKELDADYPLPPGAGHLETI